MTSMRRDRPLYRRLLGALGRPEYVLRPQQVYRRVLARRLVEVDRVTLSWGLPITADPHCYVGRDIVHLGVFDKIVPEAIFRLLDRGEIGVDAGANVGQNASAMALAVGPAGQVLAIEPHPVTAARLGRNVSRWLAHGLGNITVHQIALGGSPGTATLHEPEDFSENSGCATLLPERGDGVAHVVEVGTLDELVGNGSSIGLLKLDVEGVELDVLEGASRLMAGGRLRDIVYEDYAGQPSRLRTFLEQAGFSVFHLAESWNGPSPLATSIAVAGGANFLATRDPRRAVARYRPRGWQSLRRHRI